MQLEDDSIVEEELTHVQRGESVGYAICMKGNMTTATIHLRRKKRLMGRVGTYMEYIGTMSPKEGRPH